MKNAEVQCDFFLLCSKYWRRPISLCQLEYFPGNHSFDVYLLDLSLLESSTIKSRIGWSGFVCKLRDLKLYTVRHELKLCKFSGETDLAQ